MKTNGLNKTSAFKVTKCQHRDKAASSSIHEEKNYGEKQLRSYTRRMALRAGPEREYICCIFPQTILNVLNLREQFWRVNIFLILYPSRAKKRSDEKLRKFSIPTWVRIRSVLLSNERMRNEFC